MNRLTWPLVGAALLTLNPLARAEEARPAEAPAAPEPAASAPAVPPAAVTPPPAAPAAAEAKRAWYEKLQLRGYTQLRYNQIAVTNPNLVNEQGDKSIGGTNGFFLRRARLVLSGDVHERVSIYLQPDFAVAINDSLNAAVMRDWYADIYLDKAKEFRLRAGQSKIPFGFENLQSSSNRLSLDRNDALAAIKDERDLGVMFYWTPTEAKKRFKHLANSELKGAGDYGVVALGVFNGQNANQKEKNLSQHVVGRVAWPFLLGSQYLEVGTGGYYGKYVPKLDKGATAPEEGVTDARAHVSFVLYPQPFGLQAEYNVGVGPQNVENRVESRWLEGGYVQAMYRLGPVMPFVRGQYYDGARKAETNAPAYHVREVEAGVEWAINGALELTAQYTHSERTSLLVPDKTEIGRFGRLQLQFNY